MRAQRTRPGLVVGLANRGCPHTANLKHGASRGCPRRGNPQEPTGLPKVVTCACTTIRGGPQPSAQQCLGCRGLADRVPVQPRIPRHVATRPGGDAFLSTVNLVPLAASPSRRGFHTFLRSGLAKVPGLPQHSLRNTPGGRTLPHLDTSRVPRPSSARQISSPLPRRGGLPQRGPDRLRIPNPDERNRRSELASGDFLVGLTGSVETSPTLLTKPASLAHPAWGHRKAR